MLSALTDPSQWQFYIVTFFCLLIGILLAYLQKMKGLADMARAAGKKPPKAYAYYHDFPYQTAISALSSILGYFLLIALNELSLITAIGMGIVGEGVSDAASARAKKVLELEK